MKANQEIQQLKDKLNIARSERTDKQREVAELEEQLKQVTQYQYNADMSKKKPIQGEKVQFQFQGKDGQWHDLEEGSMQKLNIELPDTKEIQEKYKPFLDAFTKRKCIQATMRPPTAQDDLVMGMMLFSEDFMN